MPRCFGSLARLKLDDAYNAPSVHQIVAPVTYDAGGHLPNRSHELWLRIGGSVQDLRVYDFEPDIRGAIRRHLADFCVHLVHDRGILRNVERRSRAPGRRRRTLLPPEFDLPLFPGFELPAEQSTRRLTIGNEMYGWLAVRSRTRAWPRF